MAPGDGFSLKIILNPHPEDIGVAVARGWVVEEGVDVVRRKAQVIGHVPVEADGQVSEDAPFDAVVGQIEVRYARGEFPGAAAGADAVVGADAKEGLVWLHAVEHGPALAVRAVFARQNIAGRKVERAKERIGP